MADYGCDPLWFMDEDRVGCFSPREIGAPDDLREALDAWARAFDGAIDMNDPANGLGWSKAQHEAHEAEGRVLAERLAQWLGARSEVFFFTNGGASRV